MNGSKPLTGWQTLGYTIFIGGGAGVIAAVLQNSAPSFKELLGFVYLTPVGMGVLMAVLVYLPKKYTSLYAQILLLWALFQGLLELVGLLVRIPSSILVPLALAFALILRLLLWEPIKKQRAASRATRREAVRVKVKNAAIKSQESA